MEILKNEIVLLFILLIFISCDEKDTKETPLVNESHQYIDILDYLSYNQHCNMDKLLAIDCEIEIQNGKYKNYSSLAYSEDDIVKFFDIKNQDDFWFANLKTFNSNENSKFGEIAGQKLSYTTTVFNSDSIKFNKFEKLFEEAVNLNIDFNQFEDSILVELVLFKKGEYRKIRLSYNEIDSVKIFKSFLP